MLAFLGPLGPTELIIILVIIMVLFGAKKIPDLMKGIGSGIKEFKKAANEVEDKSDQDKSKNQISS